jgi:hypothetical protein
MAFLIPFSTARDELLRDHAAGDVVLEHKARCPFRHGPTSTRTWAYWPRTAGLLRVLALGFDRLEDRFAVGNFGLADVASTLNSRFMRSTMISRWSSPMPAMIV